MKGKFFALFILIAAFLLIGVAFSACGDDDDAGEPEDLGGPQEQCEAKAVEFFGDEDTCFDDETFKDSMDGDCATLEAYPDDQVTDFLACLDGLDCSEDFDDSTAFYADEDNGYASCLNLLG